MEKDTRAWQDSSASVLTPQDLHLIPETQVKKEEKRSLQSHPAELCMPYIMHVFTQEHTQDF